MRVAAAPLRPLVRPLAFEEGHEHFQWPFGDAVLGLDFLKSLFRVNRKVSRVFTAAALAGLTITRAATAYAEDSAGNLVSFAPNVARITDKGLLVEEARTNIATASQTWTTNWSGNTITANAAVAPDGTTTAGKLIEKAAGSGSTDQTAFCQVTAVGGTTYAVSIFAKAAERSWLYLRQYDATNNAGAWFNLATGAIGNVEAGVTASIKALGNGWYRCSIVFTWAAGATVGRVQPQIATGNGTGTQHVGDGASGLYIWGAQLEAGSFPTSYIPTTTASATRPADVISIGSLSIAAPYTMLAEALTLAAAGGQPLLAGSPTGSTANRWSLSSSSGAPVYSNDAAPFNISPAGSFTDNVAGKVAARLQNGSHGAAMGGGAVSTNNAAVGQTTGTLRLGNNLASGYLNNYLRRAIIYPRALSDAELQVVTR